MKERTMHDTITDHIPELHIAITGDDTDRSIYLEQETGGNLNGVAVHASQVRYMAEALGLLEKADAEAQKLIATLIRHIQVLHQRNIHLSDYLVTHADHRDAHLSYAIVYANASTEIAEQFANLNEAAHV